MTTDLDRLREAARVEHRGPQDTDVDMLRRYADNIRRGHQGGGSNLTGAVARTLDVVADLLSQPAPTVEPMQTCGVCGRQYPASDTRATCQVCWPGFGEYANPCVCAPGSPDCDGPRIDCPVHGLPPRVESMAPGTTFTGQYRAGAFLGGASRWLRDSHGVVLASTGLRISPRDIDPSTIRDVTPPAVTQ